jgi:DNA invertase Pin-like site-specific DNA recombinase
MSSSISAKAAIWIRVSTDRQHEANQIPDLERLCQRNVSLVSHREPWLNGTDSTTELLAAVAAWVATQESVRRSERIRAGLARRKAQGKPIGGAASKRGKDKRPRETEGYKQAWARRKAAPQPDDPPSRDLLKERTRQSERLVRDAYRHFSFLCCSSRAGPDP